MTEELLTIAYAAQERQLEIQIVFLSGETVLDAIQRSGILEEFPEIEISDPEQANKIGIFSKLCQFDDEPRAGDRIEIYRPLKIDPKQARRERAKSNL